MTKKDLKNLKTLFSQANVKPIFFILLIILGVVSSLVSVIPTQFIGQLTNFIAGSKLQNPGLLINLITYISNIFQNINLPIICLILYILVSVLSSIIRNLYCYLAMCFANKIINKTRKNMFNKLLVLDYSYFENHKRSSILYNILNNVSKLDYIFSHSLFSLGTDLFDLLWISVFICLINYKIFLILLALTPMLFLFSIKTGKMQRSYSQQAINQEHKMGRFIDQAVSGIDIIKVFKGESYEKKLFKTANDKLFEFSNKSNKTLCLYFVIESLLKVTGVSLALIYCVTLISRGEIPLGSFPIIVLYGKRFYAPINNLTKYYQVIQRSLVSANEVCTLLNEHEAKKYKVISDKQTFDEVININNAELVVNNTSLFKDFNLSIANNEFVIIKGESGKGKSSLLKVILGLKNLHNGSIKVNSTKPTVFTYANQGSFLHDLSLIENVLYPETKQLVAAEKRNLAVNTLIQLGFSEDILQKPVGEAGKYLSGGERQRVSLARAIVQDADVLVLDEITSSVDSSTEGKIIKLLGGIKGTKTIILVSHSSNERLLSLADRIIAL